LFSGVKGSKQSVQQLVDQTQQMMQGSEMSLYDKVTQFELLKHGQDDWNRHPQGSLLLALTLTLRSLL